jgi:hypothetical protein
MPIAESNCRRVVARPLIFIRPRRYISSAVIYGIGGEPAQALVRAQVGNVEKAASLLYFAARRHNFDHIGRKRTLLAMR